MPNRNGNGTRLRPHVGIGNKTIWIVLVTALAAFSFLGGLAVARGGMLATTAAAAPQSDVEWAQQQGYIPAGVRDSQPITQAEFLNAVMKRYGEQQTGLVVPKGAEGHWAANVYALAKAKGVVDCGCQIKPNDPVSLKQAAKFVMLAINTKAKQPLATIDGVKGWIIRKQSDDQVITYEEAATLIRKMDEVYRTNKLGGGI